MTQDAESAATDKEALDAALAILTLVTGDDWDRSKLIDQSSQLRQVAVHTMRKQGLTEEDAETFVQGRWEAYAADLPAEQPLDGPASPESAEPSPSTTVGMESSATANLGPNTAQIPTVGELRDRLADYQARQGLVTQEDPAPAEGTGSPAEPEAG